MEMALDPRGGTVYTKDMGAKNMRTREQIASQIEAIEGFESLAAARRDQGEFDRLTCAKDALLWAIGLMDEPPVWDESQEDG